MKATAKREAFEITVELDPANLAEVEAARRLLWNVENPVEKVEIARFGNLTTEGLEAAKRAVAEVNAIMRKQTAGVIVSD